MNDCNFGKLYLNKSTCEAFKYLWTAVLCVFMMKRFFVSDRKNIKLSKISSDAGRAFLRLREDWKGVGQRLPGRVLDPFIPLVG